MRRSMLLALLLVATPGGAGETGALKLTPEAKKTFGLDYLRLAAGDRWVVPSEALVFSKDEIFVYRERAGSLERVPAAIAGRAEGTMTIRSAGLAAGDRLVVKGAAALRVVELDSTSGDAGEAY